MSDDAQSTVEVTPWLLPEVEGEGFSENMDLQDVPALPTVEEIEVWEQEAREKGYREGYDKGHQEGMETGQTEIQKQIQQFSQLIDALRTPFEELDEAVETELMQMTVALAQQLVRREIRIEPGEIIGVIRDSMALLPANKRSVTIHLHSDDVALVEQTFSSQGVDKQWNLVEDPLITRGGCRIHTDVSHLDATLESRLASLAATLLGGERESDQ